MKKKKQKQKQIFSYSKSESDGSVGLDRAFIWQHSSRIWNLDLAVSSIWQKPKILPKLLLLWQHQEKKKKKLQKAETADCGEFREI